MVEGNEKPDIESLLTLAEQAEALQEANPELYLLIYNVGYSIGHVEGCRECLNKVNGILKEVYGANEPRTKAD
jgi:hypothetical protein